MMRIVAIIFLLLLTSQLVGQEMPCNIEHSPVIVNEKLSYDIYMKVGFIWIPIGESIFIVKESDDYFNAEMTARTFDGWSPLYKVNGVFRSHLSKADGLSQHYLRWTNENGETSYDSILFDQSNLICKEFLGPNPQKQVVYDLELDHCVQDMISTFYYIRTPLYENMIPGDQLPLHLFYNKYQYNIDMQFKGEEIKKIKSLGDQNCFRLEAQSIKGKHVDKSALMTCWISNDEKRIPIVFESPMKFGELRIILKSIESIP